MTQRAAVFTNGIGYANMPGSLPAEFFDATCLLEEVVEEVAVNENASREMAKAMAEISRGR